MKYYCSAECIDRNLCWTKIYFNVISVATSMSNINLLDVYVIEHL